MNATTTCITIDASTTQCGPTSIDYPILDLYLGIVLFLGCAAFIARYFSTQIHG